MMVLPIPPFLLDGLLALSLAIGIGVFLIALFIEQPLEYSAFPAIVLVATLLRLSLNVATTRQVLLHGAEGNGAAGKVVETFGRIVVGGNVLVGLVVFLILVIINFVVITKGAGRIAEVAARFTLDAMPGKQMAIDADLNAGLINQDIARRRRAEIAEEAEFFGAMDGASKFVRGDAIAGILILFINILGGLAIGILQHDLSLSVAANNYVLLAIGDGLVAQIPALIISTAAGLVVSRVGKGEHTGPQLFSQLFRQPHSLIIAAALLGTLGLVPGMPHFAFILIAGGMALMARWLLRRAQSAKTTVLPPAAPAHDALEVSWDDLVPVDAMGLEVGYRLIPLVDKGQDGELLRRIKAIRKKFAQEIGFLPPPVHIRDNLELSPYAYRILVKGVVVGEGECHVGMYLAINPGRAAGT